MKLITFDTKAGERHLGAVLPDAKSAVDFTGSSPEPWARSILALIDGGPDCLAHARSVLDAAPRIVQLADVTLCACLPRPRQMRDFLAFELHVRQGRVNRHLFGGAGGEVSDPAKVEIPRVWYEQPIYYKCNRFSVVGTGTDIVWPSYARFLDYELELGMVLGKTGKNIPRERAAEHIFGYCIFNDFSARDAQYREMPGQLGPAKGKDFDTGNAIGPWLVTADEIDPSDIPMVARINGEEWSRGTYATSHHRFEDMIVHVSKDETIHAGEFFGSGTVGNGCGVELGRYLKPGDIVELDIAGLGVLRNRVVKP